MKQNNATFVDNKLAEAEAHRREKNGQFSTKPLAKGVDYGQSVAAITLALAHLAEGIPNGQHKRSKAALEAAEAALHNLNVWFYWVNRREEDGAKELEAQNAK